MRWPSRHFVRERGAVYSAEILETFRISESTTSSPTSSASPAQARPGSPACRAGSQLALIPLQWRHQRLVVAADRAQRSNCCP